MAQRADADQPVAFGFAKGFLNDIPVNACLDDILSTPFGSAGDDDVFAEPVQPAPYLVFIPVTEHAQSLGSFFKTDIVQLFAQVLFFADSSNVLTDLSRIAPALSMAVYFSLDFHQP